MRVLHLIPGNLYGGVETFVSFLAESDFEIEHHFAICFDGRLSRELENAGAPIHRLGAMRASRPWTVLRGRRNLASVLEAHAFDAAICHSSWPLAMFGPTLARQGVPIVFYLHGPITKVSWVDRAASRITPALMIAVSRHTLSTARRIFPATPATVLHYPLPTATEIFDRSLREKFGANPSDIVLIAVSRMDPWKGHRMLIEATAQLSDLPNWNLWIVGGAQRESEKQYVRELAAQVQESGIADRVKFLGERSDAAQLLASADVFCQANSGPEGFSLAFMEAFAARLPIVTTALGGAPELIDETCGVLCPPGDALAFSEALRSLVTDADRRKQLGTNGHAKVKLLCDPAKRLADLRDCLKSIALPPSPSTLGEGWGEGRVLTTGNRFFR